MRQRRSPAHGSNNKRHRRQRNMSGQLPGGLGGVLGGYNDGNDGEAVDGLFRSGARLGEDLRGVGVVDAADADGGDGAVAGGDHGFEDVADA